jgi:hypothetical protein
MIIIIVVLAVMLAAVFALLMIVTRRNEQLKFDRDIALGALRASQYMCNVYMQSVVELTEALEDAKEDAQIHNERAENALICVQMLLDESPSQFKNVSTEIGLNGVVYQFNIEETTKE